MKQMETLEKLLKNELSATETYQQVLDKLRADVALSEAENLMPIYEDHKAAVSSLQALTARFGGTPTEVSGAWGVWAKLMLDGASILGNEVILKALHEGETIGDKDYKVALLDTELLPDIRSLIETKLLLAQQAHISTLDRLLIAETD